MSDSPVRIEIDPVSGQLRGVSDPELGFDVLSFAAGLEYQLNGAPLATTLRSVQERGGDHVTVLDAPRVTGYLAGQRFEVRRMVTAGGVGLHTGPSRSVHIRHHLRRVPWGDYTRPLDMIWGAPLEAPSHVESFGVQHAPTAFFGPDTRMRAVAIGGSGPREHVSYEDGPVAEVTPWLQSGFRSTFPGQMTVPGALYYDPRDERFVWVMVRRAHVGGRARLEADRCGWDFHYHAALRVHDELVTPEVSLLWGRGLDEAERVLARQFDRFEEPPAWWYQTARFWLHPIWQRDGDFARCEEAVRILAGECGVSGFGIAGHDVPWSGRDVDPAALGPAPAMGGEEGLARLTRTIKAHGGHSFVWSTRTGLHPVRERRDAWCVRGEDGRRLSIRPPECGVQIDVLCNADRDYRTHLFDAVRRYVVDLGVDGVFWDSGLQPMPPDFTPRPELNCPGEAMAAPLRFYEDVYRLGRSLSPDFFMWVEGISTEFRGNAFAVGHRTHGAHAGHALMHRLAHTGPRRLVWRSAWPHDLAGAFPFISPVSDIGRAPAARTYRAFAADPMNRWLCATLRERGCRHAVGLADGVSALDEFVVVCPGVDAAVATAHVKPGARLRHVLDGRVVTAREGDAGRARFELSPGPWAVESPVPAPHAAAATAATPS